MARDALIKLKRIFFLKSTLIVLVSAPGSLFTTGDLKRGQSQRNTLHIGSPRMESLIMLIIHLKQQWIGRID